MQRLAWIALLSSSACTQNEEARAFYDDVQTGSTWSLAIGANQTQCFDCPNGFAHKTGSVPSNTVAGCEAGCTCSFNFELEDNGEDLGPVVWNVSAWLIQRCEDGSRLTCWVDDADKNDSGSCMWWDGKTQGFTCPYSFAIARE